jgi:hypothetical protein
VASKLFVVLDNTGVSMVDVRKGRGKMILNVGGSNNRGIMVQKEKDSIVIHTNEVESIEKRSYIQIAIRI